jgi:hypothetical protein
MSKSLSKIPIKITLIGIGDAKAELNRLTAPLTVGAVLKRLPINARVSPAIGCVSVLIGLKRGSEKPKNNVKAGSIAYWPKGDSICIYPNDHKPYSAVNIIGKILVGLEIFQKVRSGTRIIIERVIES